MVVSICTFPSALSPSLGLCLSDRGDCVPTQLRARTLSRCPCTAQAAKGIHSLVGTAWSLPELPGPAFCCQLAGGAGQEPRAAPSPIQRPWRSTAPCHPSPPPPRGRAARAAGSAQGCSCTQGATSAERRRCCNLKRKREQGVGKGQGHRSRGDRRDSCSSCLRTAASLCSLSAHHRGLNVPHHGAPHSLGPSTLISH